MAPSLQHCASLQATRQTQVIKTTFKAVGTILLAKTQIKDEALTEELERILATEGAVAAAEAGLQTSPMEQPQANERGIIVAQLQSVILTVLVASGGQFKPGKAKQSDLAARLTKRK